ncbi:anti-sigma factor family protein [Acidovorax carolinensis]|uniref:anti-sigma factor family protein n=1 Tax=Acidovorax carolinensis TaxID=553814 RepID=UPI000B3419F6|nr:anti-sigma factor [Acidovorax carolinensis]
MDHSSPFPAGPSHDHALHALVDGRLPPADTKAVQQQLAADATAQATVAQWQAQRHQLRALHQDMLEAPLPDALLQTLARATARRDEQHRQWWRWGGMAASVLVAFALGWVGRGHWPAVAPNGLLAGNASAPSQRFAAQAAMAHAVYQPEQRHPVEVPAAQQEHLVQWLSKRLGRPLKVPLLTAQGYELVGGRLLPGDTGARAQFMYQNSAGERVTLYLGALVPTAATKLPPSAGSAVPATNTPQSSDTAFRFTQEGPVPGFYWTDQGFGYALSGQLSRPALQTLATAVYQQL